jgi:hypothetical protein|tara:strand:- start:1608 stop:2144 length:537 start_codon:yes stop_codon:yes gene_type:complete
VNADPGVGLAINEELGGDLDIRVVKLFQLRFPVFIFEGKEEGAEGVGVIEVVGVHRGHVGGINLGSRGRGIVGQSRSGSTRSPSTTGPTTGPTRTPSLDRVLLQKHAGLGAFYLVEVAISVLVELDEDLAFLCHSGRAAWSSGAAGSLRLLGRKDGEAGGEKAKDGQGGVPEGVHVPS